MSTVETSFPETRDLEAVPTPPATSPPLVDGASSTSDGRAGTETFAPKVVVRARPRARQRLTSALRGFAVVLLVVVPAGVAAYVSAQQPPTYGAVAEVLYSGGPAASQEDVDRQLATQRVLLASRSAIASTAQAVGRDPETVAKNVKTEVLEGSSVVRIQVEDRSARVARAIVTSLVTNYQTAVEQQANRGLDERRQAIDAQIVAANDRLAQINDRIRVISVGPGRLPLDQAVQAEVRTLESEAAVLRQQVVDLQQQALQLNPANPEQAIATARIVTDSTVLPEPVGPQPLRAAAAGGLLGLLLVFLLVTFVPHRHRRRADDEAAVARS